MKDSHLGIPVGEYKEEFLVKPVYDHDSETGEVYYRSAGIGQDGKEYGDPVPIEPPIGYEPPHDPIDYIRRALNSEVMRRRAEEEGIDTFDEAGDFDVEDDPDLPLTMHEALLHPQTAERVRQQKEIDDGVSAVEEGRGSNGDPGSRKSGKVGKDKSKPQPEPADKGSVPEGSVASDDVEV